MPKKRKQGPGPGQQNKNKGKNAQSNNKNKKLQQQQQQQQAQFVVQTKKGGGGGNAAPEADLSDLGQELREVVAANNGQPVNMAQLPARFLKTHGRELKTTDYGCGKLRDLVESCGDAVSLQANEAASGVLHLCYGSRSGGQKQKRHAAEATAEPSPKTKKQKGADADAAGAKTGGATLPLPKNMSAEEIAGELKILAQRKAKFGLSGKGEARLAVLQSYQDGGASPAAASSTAPSAEKEKGAGAAVGARPSCKPSPPPPRKSVLDRLGKTGEGAQPGKKGTEATKGDARGILQRLGKGGGRVNGIITKIEGAATADAVFALSIEDGREQGHEDLPIFVAALQRFAALCKEAVSSGTEREPRDAFSHHDRGSLHIAID